MSEERKPANAQLRGFTNDGKASATSSNVDHEQDDLGCYAASFLRPLAEGRYELKRRLLSMSLPRPEPSSGLPEAAPQHPRAGPS